VTSHALPSKGKVPIGVRGAALRGNDKLRSLNNCHCAELHVRIVKKSKRASIRNYLSS
jgi:hypothetical protein